MLTPVKMLPEINMFTESLTKISESTIRVVRP